MEELDIERALRHQQTDNNAILHLENISLSLLFQEATQILSKNRKKAGKKIIIIGLENSGKSAVGNHICGERVF